MKSLGTLLFLALALGADVLEAHANPITFSFTAIVASAEPVFPTVHPGDLVIGHYAFESTTPDSDPSPRRGLYLSAGTFDAKIGTLSFNFPLSGIEVLDHLVAGSDPGYDRYTVAAQSGNTLLELTLFDAASQDPFSSDSLPLVPPPLSKFDDSKIFEVFLRDAPGSDFVPKIAANVTTLVPAPSALLLLVAGFAGLGGVAWTRRRRNLSTSYDGFTSLGGTSQRPRPRLDLSMASRSRTYTRM
jgi:hypothetical protein